MAKKEKAATLPFVGNMNEGIDFAKRMWGLTGMPTLPTASGVTQFAQRLPQALPSMIAPTLDVDELDRRIADLRAVEQWLDLNMSMLRTAIQSLEVQRNTIATLKSFGGAMLSASAAAAATPAPGSSDAAAAAAMQAAAARKQAAELAAATAAAAAAARAEEQPAAPAAQAPDADALALNPVAWWSSLQQQFGKIAASAAAEMQAAARRNAENEQKSARPAKRVKATSEGKPRAASPRPAPAGGKPRRRGGSGTTPADE